MKIGKLANTGGETHTTKLITWVLRIVAYGMNSQIVQKRVVLLPELVLDMATTL